MGTFVAAWALRRLVALCALNFAATQLSSPFGGLLLHNLRAFYLESWRVEMTLLPLEERENGLPPDLEAARSPRDFAGVIGAGVPNRAAQWMQARALPFFNYAGSGAVMVAQPRDILLKRGVQILATRGCERIGY